MIKIVADENIAFAEEAFSTLGSVILKPGREINNEVLREADVLLTRSITRVNDSLLKDTKVKFVGTATIGTDHIDLDYLQKNNIAFADAKGCNANAVKEYVFSALFSIAAAKRIRLKDLTIGIIGAGNIGSKVAVTAAEIGMKVMLNDPPLKRLTGNDIYLELDEVIKADIITLHVPLNHSGIDKTFNLMDEKKLSKLKKGCIFINTSRGEVVNNKVLELLDDPLLTLVLDVWENEPQINKRLLEKTDIGTPHIAGYSLEGKINGTVMIYNALCRHMKAKPVWQPEYPSITVSVIEAEEKGNEEEILNRIISSIYDIRTDDAALRKISIMNEREWGRHFDDLRKNYPLRREFMNYRVKGIKNKREVALLRALNINSD